MYQVYICTEGDASDHLYSRYEPNAANPFKTAQEIIDYFKQIHSNPHQVREARYEYRELKMKSGDIFFEFQTAFQRLANKAQIPSSEWFDDLYDKLTLRLQSQMVVHRYTLNQDLTKLVELAAGIDTENRRMAKSRAANAAKSPPPSLSKTFIQASSSADKSLTRGITPAPTLAPPTIPTKAPSPQPTSITCFACKAPGHVVADCPTKKGWTEMKEIADEDEAKSESGKEYA
jgi:hypothetical protein